MAGINSCIKSNFVLLLPSPLKVKYGGKSIGYIEPNILLIIFKF